MGLDNIPKNYPCKTKGTAVLVNRKNSETGEDVVDTDTGETMTQIDCNATQACGGCPWKNAYEASNLEGGMASGMFGTDCWYRGKYGNHIIEELAGDNDEFSFYGDNEDGTEKSVSSCISTADYIDELLANKFAPEIAVDARYASWWLRWAAEEADGSVCWY